MKHWIDNKITYLVDLQNDQGEIFSYEEFLRSKIFPISYKEYQMVTTPITKHNLNFEARYIIVCLNSLFNLILIIVR